MFVNSQRCDGVDSWIKESGDPVESGLEYSFESSVKAIKLGEITKKRLRDEKRWSVRQEEIQGHWGILEVSEDILSRKQGVILLILSEMKAET